MKLEDTGVIMYIDDKSDKAKKISDGCDYSIIGDEIVVESTGNKKDIKALIDNATSVEDLKVILKKLIKDII